MNLTIFLLACWNCLVCTCLMGQSVTFTEFPLPTVPTDSLGITTGPDAALWFTEYFASKIGRITTAGAVTEFPLPSSGRRPDQITAGPDGALWFAENPESGGGMIGRITTSGVISEFALPISPHVEGITTGSDGALWFADYGAHTIGRITTSGVVREFPAPTPLIQPSAITSGPDGALWFIAAKGQIGRITTAGVITMFPAPAVGADFGHDITSGPDGALWFTGVGKIGRITTGGVVTEFPMPTAGSLSYGITTGADGALWFTGDGKIGRITTDGVITEFPMPTLGSLAYGITTGPDGALWFPEVFWESLIGRADPSGMLIVPTGAPTITKIQNNSNSVPAGFTNYGVIAPSSLFIVAGSNLADPGEPVLQNAEVGLPLTLNGTRIEVSVNGVTVRPALYYASPKQLAAVLPAATPIGTGILTVMYRGLFRSVPIEVVSSAVGISSDSGGLAVAQEPSTGALFSYTYSAAPGTAVTFWSTGLGANPADSDTRLSSTPHRVNTPLEVYVGGVQATNILYQGSAGYPGVNIITVSIPESVHPGCRVSVAAVTGSVVSNIATIPVATVTGGICSDPEFGMSGDQLALLSSQTTVKTGSVKVSSLSRPDGTFATASADFSQVTGSSFLLSRSVSIRGCILTQTGAVPSLTGLNAGTLGVSYPSGGFEAIFPLAGLGRYVAIPPAGAITPGVFAFSGSGSQVGRFNATVNLPSPIFAWTERWDPSLSGGADRTRGMRVTWSGGGPGTYVTISGSSPSGPFFDSPRGSFTCNAPGAAGEFTVPPYVLMALPAGTGTITVENSTNSAPFSALGLDFGAASVVLSYVRNASFF
jgi:virginiamycin B lyase